MPRPEFPNCVMTPGIIQRIREDQDYYDKNPERTEREQRGREERRQEELQREREEEQRMLDRQEE